MIYHSARGEYEGRMITGFWGKEVRGALLHKRKEKRRDTAFRSRKYLKKGRTKTGRRRNKPSLMRSVGRREGGPHPARRGKNKTGGGRVGGHRGGHVRHVKEKNKSARGTFERG